MSGMLDLQRVCFHMRLAGLQSPERIFWRTFDRVRGRNWKQTCSFSLQPEKWHIWRCSRYLWLMWAVGIIGAALSSSVPWSWAVLWSPTRPVLAPECRMAFIVFHGARDSSGKEGQKINNSRGVSDWKPKKSTVIEAPNPSLLRNWADFN